jgi:tetratricopeptide (TPR) repeat protein
METLHKTVAALLALALIAGSRPLLGIPAPESVTRDGWPQPMQLDAEARDWVRRTISAGQSPERRMRMIWRSLTGSDALGMREDMARTRTATEAFQQRRANCVGFALLMVALSREVGVPAFFVVIEDSGVARRRDTFTVAENHLATAVDEGGRLRIFDFGGESAPDEYRAIPVTDLAAIALYHSNRGVETLLDGDLGGAVRWLRRAVDLDPGLAPAWVNLGVALRRSGDDQGAREAYEEALRIDPAAASAYDNLAALLRSRGRSQEAAEVLEVADRARSGDAFSYLRLARQSLESGDLAGARSFYRKALELSRQR